MIAGARSASAASTTAFERIAVPCLEVPECVARARGRPPGGSSAGRGARRVALEEGVGLGAGEQPGGAAEVGARRGADHAGELERAAQRPVLEQPVDEPGGEGVAGAGRLDEVDVGGRQLERLVAGRREQPTFAERDDDRAGAELEQALRLSARIALARERGCFVVVRDEVVDLGQDVRDVVERQRPAGRRDDVEDDARAGLPREP